jgi:hypothetical protein
MLRVLFIVVLVVTVSSVLSAQSNAQEPIKWSAPMSDYPRQWAPTTPPPQPTYSYGPWGYQYPSGAFGQGGYGGYGGQRAYGTQGAYGAQGAYDAQGGYGDYGTGSGYQAGPDRQAYRRQGAPPPARYVPGPMDWLLGLTGHRGPGPRSTQDAYADNPYVNPFHPYYHYYGQR